MRVVREDELWHYGVPGMKWGHHKYVDDEGNLTEHAKKKFASGMDEKHVQKQINKAEWRTFNTNQKKYIQEREYQDKINKLRSKALKKADPNKYDKKIKKLAAKRNKANEYIAKGQSFVDKIVKENNKRGYTTEDTDDVKTAFTSSTGAAVVGGIIAGAWGGMILGGSTMKSLPVMTKHAVVTGHPEVGENYREPKKKRKES